MLSLLFYIIAGSVIFAIMAGAADLINLFFWRQKCFYCGSFYFRLYYYSKLLKNQSKGPGDAFPGLFIFAGSYAAWDPFARLTASRSATGPLYIIPTLCFIGIAFLYAVLRLSEALYRLFISAWYRYPMKAKSPYAGAYRLIFAYVDGRQVHDGDGSTAAGS